jgi:hypothetical protein
MTMISDNGDDCGDGDDGDCGDGDGDDDGDDDDCGDDDDNESNNEIRMEKRFASSRCLPMEHV